MNRVSMGVGDMEEEEWDQVPSTKRAIGSERDAEKDGASDERLNKDGAIARKKTLMILDEELMLTDGECLYLLPERAGVRLRLRS